MELQLKHLAPYLAYDLKMISNTEGKSAYDRIEKRRLKKIETAKFSNIEFLLFLRRKPLLRPLSDLTKEIEVNGEKFVPFERIAIYSSVEYLIYQIQTGLVEVIVYSLLVSWHFDVHNLIPSDLAIDANTLNQK